MYIDDNIVTRGDETKKNKLSQRLVQEFKIKALGRLKNFLGIEVTYLKASIFISQQKYIVDRLQETSMTTCKLVSIPSWKKLEMNQLPTMRNIKDWLAY